jgi:glycosyltransferase involved in cell wall biosynthesis
VVSAVNLTEGGPLTVLREFVDAACAILSPEWEIIIFVHDKGLLSAVRPRLIAIPRAKRGWLRRLWVEWHQFRRYARSLAPDLWISLHDMTPNVGRVRQVVYCHNPSPFYSVRTRDAFFEPKQLWFRLGYALLYRININRNCAVIVQQSWLRERFRKWVSAATEIIVAHPDTASTFDYGGSDRNKPDGRAVFIYPSLPRPFKNLELVCRAVARLERGTSWRSEVVLTVDGTENRYSQWLRNKYGRLKTIRFAGRQSPPQLHSLYSTSDCLLFPSRMETWGLPITEAKRYHLPMFVANLPYARETVGNYDSVEFIDIDDDEALSPKLLAFQEGEFQFRGAFFDQPEEPFASDWTALIELLIRDVTQELTAE